MVRVWEKDFEGGKEAEPLGFEEKRLAVVEVAEQAIDSLSLSLSLYAAQGGWRIGG